MNRVGFGVRIPRGSGFLSLIAKLKNEKESTAESTY